MFEGNTLKLSLKIKSALGPMCVCVTMSDIYVK